MTLFRVQKFYQFMENNLTQFVPSEVCLKCDGCCRFKEKDSVWRPKMAQEEIAQNDGKRGLADLILSKETFSKEGTIKTVTCHGEHLCSFFNPQDHTCRIYFARPFECRLYPFVLTKQQQKAAVFVHLMCPYVQQERRTRHFEDYVVYLKKFFQESEVLAFLERNPALVGDYSDYREELEYLFTLPSCVIANDRRE